MGIGAGSDTNTPLAVGMINSTLLTLIIVPVVFHWWKNGLQHMRHWMTRRSAKALGSEKSAD